MNRLRQPVSGPASANQRWIDDKIVNIETKSAGSLTGKYLTFNLQAESYGIDVLKVREIIRHTIITLVPQMPAYIRGVINLRGKIIPVMDLRIRFEFATANSDQTCVIVVQVTLPDGKATQMGWWWMAWRRFSTSARMILKRRQILAGKFARTTSLALPKSKVRSRRCWILTALLVREMEL